MSTVYYKRNLVGSVITSSLADNATPYRIDSFVGPSDVEIGTSLVEPSFTASHNREPSSLQLTNDDNSEDKSVIATPNNFSSSQTYSKSTPNESVTFTLSGATASKSDSETTSINWRARLFVGWTTKASGYVEADILALSELSNTLSDGVQFDLTLNPTNGGSGAYLIACYHEDFAGLVPGNFQIGDLAPGAVSEFQTTLAMTTPAGSQNYIVARSDLAVEEPTGINFKRVC